MVATGHYNTDRHAMWLGGYWGDGDSPQTISSIEAIYDFTIGNASRADIYVILDNHSTADAQQGCADWTKANEFWTAIAPRYANNTTSATRSRTNPTTVAP